MKRILFIFLGFISLLLSLLGLVLPLLPTTPLVLLSAACFARSSHRFHSWLTGNRLFGPIIINWERNKTIPRKAKIISILMLNVSILISASFFVSKPIILIVLFVTAISVSLYLYKLPTSKAPF